ncbi:hypothetical protein, partial [Citrobacter freundii]|uniref:hypothetical protein n=1 Tax=Citrobacter freundii TaxID=546 RepID=UPI001F14F6FB
MFKQASSGRPSGIVETGFIAASRASFGFAEHQILAMFPATTGLAPIFPYTFYHLTHYWFAAADIPVAN